MAAPDAAAYGTVRATVAEAAGVPLNWRCRVSATSLTAELHDRAARLRLAGVAGLPALLFGLRLWASVCLALYLAFWLQLENAAWAATTAGLVCQPHLGASLRKGRFRLIGTVIGGAAAVMLAVCFAQDRIGFLLGLTLWGAGCAVVATLLRNFAAYGAALSGYTAAVIAADILGATGGADGRAAEFALARASEIGLGIVCAGVVLAGTDLGGARQRIAALLDGLISQIAGGFVAGLQPGAAGTAASQPVRRELIRQVAALDPPMDEAIGESSGRRRGAALPTTVMGGLFAMLAHWRTVATHLAALPEAAARREADAILGSIPPELGTIMQRGAPGQWSARPAVLLAQSAAAAQALAAHPAETPSRRLMLDRTAGFLRGLTRALRGLALWSDDAGRVPMPDHPVRFPVPDWYPAFHNGVRAFLAIAVAIVFWVLSAWPSGAVALIWVMVPVTLFGSLADRAYPSAVSMTAGFMLAIVLAGLVTFVVLPRLDGFLELALAMGLVLVPVGALAALPWSRAAVFSGAAVGITPIIDPSNQMTYDAAQFFNGAIATVLGLGFGALWFLLMPPLSAQRRTQRLLDLTARDLRRLAARPARWTPEAWEGRVEARLAVLPDEAEPAQRGRLLAALTLGAELIRLHGMAGMPDIGPGLRRLFAALARGDVGAALAEQDVFASTDVPTAEALLRVRGSLLAVREALAAHPDSLDTGGGA